MGAQINAAISDLPAGGGIIDATAFQGAQSAATTITINKPCILKLGGVTLTLAGSPGINLSSNGASIQGKGWNTTILSTSSGTADVIQTNALGNSVYDLSILSSVARTGGAGLHPLGGDGHFARLSIDKTFNGIQLTDSNGGANGINHYSDIIMGSIASSGSWNCGILIGNIASGTVSVQIFERLIVQGGPYTTAVIQLDSGADTVLFTDCVISLNTDSSGIIIAKNNTAQAPRWCRFHGCTVEPGPTKECFTIFNATSLQIINCDLDDCLRAIDIVGGTDISIESCTIDGPQSQGITLGTATGVRISNNRISDTSFAANGGSNAIEISPGTTDFTIIGNDFTSISSTNKPANNVNIQAGGSDRYIVMGNLFANFTVAGLTDLGTGTNKFTGLNSPSTIGNVLEGPQNIIGTITKYNNIPTVSNGIPYEVATVDLTAQSAAIGTTTLYTVPASGAGQYRLSWNAKITTAAGVSSTLGGLTITYTDPDGIAVPATVVGADISGGTIASTATTNNTATGLWGIPLLLNCKASTNITYSMGYASNAANAMQYNLHIKLEAL